MAETPGASKRRMRMLLLAIPVLAVVAVVVNLGSLAQIARGERTLKGVILGLGGNKHEELGGFQVPPDSGAEEAKVTIEVFLRGGDGCHAPTAIKGAALGEVLDGERVRVVFRDTATQEGLKRFQEAKVGCEQGMAVNGKVKFELKDRSGDGKPRVVYLTAEHALGSGHAASGADTAADNATAAAEEGTSPADEATPKSEGQGVTADPLQQLGEVLDQELRDKYDGRGLGFTPTEFATKMQLAMTIVEEHMRAEAKARAEAQQGGK